MSENGEYLILFDRDSEIVNSYVLTKFFSQIIDKDWVIRIIYLLIGWLSLVWLLEIFDTLFLLETEAAGSSDPKSVGHDLVKVDI